MKMCSSKLCNGCGLCKNVCPKTAVEMKSDGILGHKRPVVDNSKCIECGLCQKKCPNNEKIDIHPIQKTYAAWVLDDEKHYSSSSGGIAAAIYETCLNRGGWIVGVSNHEFFEPQYMLTNDKNDIEKFKCSKYVQPDTNDIYNQVLEKLKEDVEVAFIGLPCHCAAMKKRAVGYDEKLLLVDLICHGVPSYAVFKSHLSYIEKKTGKKTTAVRFRDRFSGEKLSCIDDNSVFYSRGLHEDIYMHSFISGDLLADSCYNCRYACSSRVGDITIGDFWGLGQQIPFTKNVDRVSASLINSKKGQVCFDSLKELLYFEERPTEEAITGNAKLREPSHRGANRDYFVECFASGNVESGLIKKYKNFAERNYTKRITKDTIKRILKKLRVKRFADVQ